MSGLLPVAEALRRVLAGVERPLEAEDVPLQSCPGRILAADVSALRTQPPFTNAAMDGYAVRAEDVARAPVSLRVVGASAAGHGYEGKPIGPGEAVRIFTGASMPAGADTVVIQENAEPRGETVVIRIGAPEKTFVRPAGLDFRAGETLLTGATLLDAGSVALAAAMGHASLPVRRRPRVAVLATGDELVRPGDAAGPDQIVASNHLALGAIAERAGGEAIDLGIASDAPAALADAVRAAKEVRADLLLTLGGASVGEHDLVRSALAQEGLELGFWRVALRPGKPLMQGRLGPMLVIGLPGNPVSAIVCGILFVVPAIRALLGLPDAGADPSGPAILGADLPANDARQDYLRARLEEAAGAPPRAFAFRRQDSSMMSVLARSQALIVREPNVPAARAGDPCRIIRLARFL